MILFKKKRDIQEFIAGYHQKNQQVGFVPTMGALHQGHLQLLQAARRHSDLTVCSIFVNPTQFNDKKDLEKYPRTIEKDLELLEHQGCDVVFYPEVEEIYPEGTGQGSPYDLGELEFILEGRYRPGHFQGVADVVSRLFDCVRPDQVFFGQKDLQQCSVIAHLIATTPDFRHIRMHQVPTLREASGLAMSSRNARLTPEQLQAAPAIYHTLLHLKEHLVPGDLTGLLQQAAERLAHAGFRTDYVTIAETDTLKECTRWDGQTPVSGLIAAYLGEVRLIDNMPLN
ncbi:pantoate--beta-alanine ligase [Niabella beijingensis]|uniref:pantoate--beta-alanine ligase n=1 Tax=Niabella beijingensis TaxID=2872700 RepID=UPI001CC03D05|nr:pantoate--beta-alanine ligase [Niabella beijingensis]MBZ4191157.1 pantoate--beta-alanine ligase [Niabella beijingensis]